MQPATSEHPLRLKPVGWRWRCPASVSSVPAADSFYTAPLHFSPLVWLSGSVWLADWAPC
ncbi:MAG: hypothetical protein CMJ59_25020 [Planctomycetaceae bacterium]|nr:hypothetical protein [Planctomycetaceae bacterium]